MNNISEIKFTHVGGPTAIVEIAGLRFLTDPVFDPPGEHYSFGWGTGSKKLAGPAIAANDVGEIDAVLLSHDQHADNLDPTGRLLLPKAKQTVTTQVGARRLGENAVGLFPWQSIVVRSAEGLEITVTAVPARHGPPLSGGIVGKVIGFVLEWEGQRNGALYFSGDTVRYAGTEEIGRRFDVGTAVLHLGGVRFPISGPFRYTLNAKEAVAVAEDLAVSTLIPVHFEGWSHFRESQLSAGKIFAASPVADGVIWPELGKPIEISV